MRWGGGIGVGRASRERTLWVILPGEGVTEDVAKEAGDGRHHGFHKYSPGPLT